MMDETAKLVLQRLEALQGARGVWESMWKRTAQRVWPDADEFQEERRTPGQRRDQRMFDHTPMEACEKFAAVMESLLTPRQRQWHTLRASDEGLHEDPAVKEWFEQVTKILFAVRSSPRATFYSEKHRGYKSLGAFGNECLLVEEIPSGGIRYRNCHLGDVYVDTDPHGRVNLLIRKRMLSADAAVRRWGNLVPEAIMRAAEKTPCHEFAFVHAVMPNGDHVPDALDYRGMPWSSFEICVEPGQTMDRGGYQELPYMFSRYTVAPNEKYGRGPAQLVLPAIMMLNRMKRDFIRAGHRAVEPPLLVHDDGIIGRGSNRIRLGAGQVTMGGVDAQGRQTILPLVSGVDIPEFQFMLEEERRGIRDAFLVPLYEVLLENPQMTATQVLELVRQNGMLIAPMIGRQHSEMLGPMIEREVAILGRQGVLPPMPQALQDAEYEIVYESPGTRQQRTEDALSLQRTLEGLALMIDRDPTVLENFKSDEVARGLADVHGVPRKWLRTEREMEALAERRAQEAQAQQQMMELQQGAAAGKDLAQAAAAVGG